MIKTTVELSSYCSVVLARWQTLALMKWLTYCTHFLSSQVAQSLISASVCACACGSVRVERESGGGRGGEQREHQQQQHTVNPLLAPSADA